MYNPKATERVPIGMIFNNTIFVFLVPLGKVKIFFEHGISLCLVFNTDQTLGRQTIQNDKVGSVKLV